MTETARQLSAEDLAFYRENGYVRVEQLITPAEVRELSADYDAAVGGEFGDLRWEGRRVEGRMVQLGNCQRVIKRWQTHNYMRHASAIARQLEGEDVVYSYDQLIMKPPQYAKETEWHQDAGYWQNDRACTCWLALTPATAASGAMQFIPKSHLHGILPHVDASEYSEINNALEAEVSHYDASTAVTVELDPGACTFHHCRTLHYASGNATDWPRKGLITHFQPSMATPPKL